ncbi:MAG TPA: TonB-dependent receptor [Prolixibacteraceae bacterium]|nr:TonB-dependent receptor [Prolixibacteraceae bacterium]
MVLAVGFTLPTIAQEKVDTSKTVNFDEVVVTGTKTAVTRNNIPLTVSVISNEKIENSSESSLLPVLSGQVPGLFVTERGVTGFGVSTGAAGQISLRGIGGSPSTQVLVLLNGNPQFMGIMGHPLADAYVASDVEKVEVIRGPASTLYGTNAMGGVINIITKEQNTEGFNANARLMYGSYNTQKYMANGGFKKKGFNVFASFNHDQTDGHRDSSDFSINNGYLRMGYNIDKHLSVNADFSMENFKGTDPGPEGSNAGYTLDITRGMGAVALNNKYDKTNGSFRFFYNFGEHTITDGFHSKDKNYGVVVYQAFSLFKGNTFTLGADFKNYGGIAENTLAMKGVGMVFGDTTVWELAGYAYMQQELFKKLVLNAGFRLEHNSVYGNEPVPTVGLAYHLAPATTIKASVAKGFRSPTIKELYLWAPANEELKPERMMNYEIGVTQQLFENKLSLELTGFKANGENLIKTVNFKNINTGTFSNTGIEFAGTYRPARNLNFNVSYSYLSMEEPIVATPEQQLYVSGTYRWNKFGFNLSVQHIQNLYTQVTPEEVVNSYTLLNSNVSYTINQYIDLFVKGENLTDTEYSINYGYPMPGIVVFGGINLHF